MLDLSILLQILIDLLNPPPRQLALGGVVHDGQLNIVDPILVLQHVVGLATITECGEPPEYGLPPRRDGWVVFAVADAENVAETDLPLATQADGARSHLDPDRFDLIGR